MKLKEWLKENYMGIIISLAIIFAMFYFTIPESHFKIYKGILNEGGYIMSEINETKELSVEWLNSNCDCLERLSSGKLNKLCNKARTISPDCFDCRVYDCITYFVEVE